MSNVWSPSLATWLSLFIFNWLTLSQLSMLVAFFFFFCFLKPLYKDLEQIRKRKLWQSSLWWPLDVPSLACLRDCLVFMPRNTYFCNRFCLPEVPKVEPGLGFLFPLTVVSKYQNRCGMSPGIFCCCFAQVWATKTVAAFDMLFHTS